MTQDRKRLTCNGVCGKNDICPDCFPEAFSAKEFDKAYELETSLMEKFIRNPRLVFWATWLVSFVPFMALLTTLIVAHPTGEWYTKIAWLAFVGTLLGAFLFEMAYSISKGLDKDF